MLSALFLAGMINPIAAADQPAARSAGKSITPSEAAPATPRAREAMVVRTKPDPNDPVEKEFQKLMAADDAAQADIDKMITENQKFVDQGAGITQSTLKARVLLRFEPVQQG